MTPRSALLATVLVALVTGCTAPPTPVSTSPGPAPAAAPGPDASLPSRLVAEVTGDGAYQHLAELQRIADANGGNRAMGTPGFDASVEYVAGVLRAAGYDVTTPEFAAGRFSVQNEQLTVAGSTVPARALGYSPATPPGGISGPLFVTPGEGCDAAALAGAPAGSVVLVRRGTCSFGQKSTAAARAGAAAVLVVNIEDGTLDSATLGGTTAGTVPTAGLARADGEAVRPARERR